MQTILILVVACLLLVLVLYFERKENRQGLIPTKGALSCLFIIAAWVQARPIPPYYELLMAGLFFCMVGDVFLAMTQKKAFLFGLIAFLLGHAFYVLGFFYVSETGYWVIAGALFFVLVSGWVLHWLWPHLGSMKMPVLVYVVVITFMVIGAWSVLMDPRLMYTGRIMAYGGAVCFYLSDLFVARERFVRQSFVNRIVGLPLYYTGQFMLAFSVRSMMLYPGYLVVLE